MISDPSFHGATSIVVLHSEPDVRHQASIVLWNRALHLFSKRHIQVQINQAIKSTERSTDRLRFTNQETRKSDFTEKQPKTSQKIKIKQFQNRIQTLISLNGIKRLFSSLESNPRIRAAWRKFLFVAARAFIATTNGTTLRENWNRDSRKTNGR